MRALWLILSLIVSPALAAGTFLFPVEGQWLAAEGPPCAGCAPAERSALGLVPLDLFGRPAASCINRPVMAPAAGIVVEARGDRPNQPEPAGAPGNFIRLRLADGSLLTLGGLMRDSVKAKPGDAIAAGQAVARCGSMLRLTLADASGQGQAIPFANLEVRTPGGCMATRLLYRGQGTC